MPEAVTAPETETTVKTTVTSKPKSGARRARARAKNKTATAKSAARTTRKKKGPNAAELATVEELRRELAEARAELDSARAEIAEVVGACRDAESRVAATRSGADAIRRAVAELDSTAAGVRGLAEATQIEVTRACDESERAEARIGLMRTWLLETRAEFAALDAEAKRTLDTFRAAVEQTRSGLPADAPEVEAPSVAELPEVTPLSPEERAEDLRDRLVHLLSDAWGVEKEQVGLLQTLADECGDREIRELLEQHRATCQARQEAVEARLESLGAKPASGRGLLGQLVTRIWDAVQAPRDQADKAVLALLKALSAAEFQAGLYAAAHAYARSAGGSETAEQVASYFREERSRAQELRLALGPTVERAARK